MAEEPKTLWAVYTTDDLTEGRTGQYVKCICEIEATAIRLGHRGYVQGTNCPIGQVQTQVIDGKHFLNLGYVRIHRPSADDVREQKAVDARRSAQGRAKQLGLTDEEIAWLKA